MNAFLIKKCIGQVNCIHIIQDLIFFYNVRLRGLAVVFISCPFNAVCFSFVFLQKLWAPVMDYPNFS